MLVARSSSDPAQPSRFRAAVFKATRGFQLNLFCASCPTCVHFILGAVYSRPLPPHYSISMRLFCASDLLFIRWRKIALTFIWHSLSCGVHLSAGKQSRCSSEQGTRALPLQPCLRRGGSGCIRTRPNSRLVGRVRMHPTYHGSGRLASHSILAPGPRRVRLRAHAQRRGDRLGRPASQPRLPAPLSAERGRSRQDPASALRPVPLAPRKPALRLRAPGTPSLLSIRR